MVFVRVGMLNTHVCWRKPISARAADDFAAIRARLEELRRAPGELAARADIAPNARYPRDLIDAVKRVLQDIARRSAGPAS